MNSDASPATDNFPGYTLDAPCRARFTDRGSRFLAEARETVDKMAAHRFLATIKSNHPDASHHVYSWRLSPPEIPELASDDGEPPGTAGLPVLGVLRSMHLVQVTLVIARYFGGTKLGKPGLIQAYRESARHCLQGAPKRRLLSYVAFEMSWPYTMQHFVDELTHEFRLLVLNAQYTERIDATLYCPADNSRSAEKKIRHYAHTGIRFRNKGTRYRPEPVHKSTHTNCNP